MTDPAPPAPAPRRAMFVVFLVVAIDLLGFGVVLPLVPRYVDRYLTESAGLSRGLWVGLLYSSFSLMQFIFSPVWGRVSDRIGRRPVLLISLAGSVAFYALFGYASTLPAEDGTLALLLLLLARVGAGIAGASVSTAAAVVADCTVPEKRAKGMALIGFAFGIGFTFGPLIAWGGDSIFGGAAWGPGALASGVALVALALAAVLFRETLDPDRPRPRHGFFSVGRTLEVLKSPAVGPLVLTYFLAIFAFANFEATLSLLTKSAFGMSDRDNYLVFAYVGLALAISQGAIYRPLAGRRSEIDLLTLGVGLMMLGLGALAVVAYAAGQLPREGTEIVEGAMVTVNAPLLGIIKPLFYVAMTVAVLGFAFVNPSISALVSRRSDPARQGEVQGVSQACASLGRIAGPVAGSLAFELHPSRVLPYAVAAAVMLGVAMLLPSVRGAGTPPASET